MPTVLQDRSHLPQLRAMNHRHEGLLSWLILNPHRPLYECARELGYSPTWVSMVVHSDMFQALYREECQKRNQLAVHTITNKLSGLTVLALDKSIEKIESGSATERFLGETTKNALAALGYGAKSEAQGTQKHLHVHVDGNALVEARERAAQLHRGSSRSSVIELPVTEPEVRGPSDGQKQFPFNDVQNQSPFTGEQPSLFEPVPGEVDDILALLGDSPSVEASL